MKDNALYEVVETRQVPRNRNILSDEVIVLTGTKAQERCPYPLRRVAAYDPEGDRVLVFLTNHLQLGASTISATYKDRWQVGVSREVCITQSVEVRPGPRDPRPCSLGGTGERERGGEALRQHSLKGGCATLQVATCSERRGSLVTRISPVAETVDNVRRQQGIAETGHMRYRSPAGYQRRHEAKGYAGTGEVLDARRANPGDRVVPITLKGKWRNRHQDGGSGRSTIDPRAAKRAGREGPGPAGIPLLFSEVGVR